MELNEEREKIKPFIEEAVDYHNKARSEAGLRNYEEAAKLYREAIKAYTNALSHGPKYYLQELSERVEHVKKEYVNNTFNSRVSGDSLKTEKGICDFTAFIDNLKKEERTYIAPYDIACSFIRIADFYYERQELGRSHEFYNKVVQLQCDRPFIYRDAYFKMAIIRHRQKRYKEAVVIFVSVLSFDRDNKEVIDYLLDCLRKLGILEYKGKFLKATPKEAKKLIMEVL